MSGIANWTGIRWIRALDDASRPSDGDLLDWKEREKECGLCTASCNGFPKSCQDDDGRVKGRYNLEYKRRATEMASETFHQDAGTRVETGCVKRAASGNGSCSGRR